MSKEQRQTQIHCKPILVFSYDLGQAEQFFVKQRNTKSQKSKGEGSVPHLKFLPSIASTSTSTYPPILKQATHPPTLPPTQPSK